MPGFLFYPNISLGLPRSVEQGTRYGTTFLKPGTTISISSTLQRHMDQKKVMSICLSKKENISDRSSTPYTWDTDIVGSYEHLLFGLEHIYEIFSRNPGEHLIYEVGIHSHEWKLYFHAGKCMRIHPIGNLMTLWHSYWSAIQMSI